MENMNGVPSALSYSLNTLQGCSFNSFELAPSTGASSYAANSQCRFMLPSVGLADLKTSKISFTVETVESKGCRIGAGIHSLVSRMELKAGGVTIYNGHSQFNMMEDIKVNMGVKTLDPATGHPEMLDRTDALGNSIATANLSETYATGPGANNNIFSIDLGDIADTIQPRLLSLELLPAIEVIITFADNNVLSAVKEPLLPGVGNDMTVKHASAGDAAFTVKNPRMFVNMYSLSSGAYSNALRARMEDVGYLSICYENNLLFNNSWTGSSRFSLSAMSLNRLVAVWRRANATTVGGAIPIAGYAAKTAPRYGHLGSGAAAENGEVHYQTMMQQYSLPVSVSAQAQTETTIGSGAAYKYTGTGRTQFQFKIQSSQVPQYFADIGQQAELSKHAFNVDRMKAETLHQYLYNRHVFAVGLNLPESKYEKKVISGLNTSATNCAIELVSSGTDVSTDGTFECFIFANCSQILRCGAGKAIELIN